MEQRDRLSEAGKRSPEPRGQAERACDTNRHRERPRRWRRVPHVPWHGDGGAKGEVIVSGGVYGSPQLLLLSGIGPGDHLNEMGIEVTHDLAPVGANLHDHFNSYVAWRSTKTGTFNELARSPFRKLAAGARYAGWTTRADDSHRHACRHPDPHGPALRSSRSPDQHLSLVDRDPGPHRHAPPQMAGVQHVSRSLASRRSRAGEPAKPRPARPAEDRVQVHGNRT